MKKKDLDKIYKNVPPDQKQRIIEFRSSHPHQQVTTDGVVWEYISCGHGDKTLVLLPGGMGFCDALFLLITALEKGVHIISPTYPQLTTMAELADGITGILDSVHIDKADILGVSFGGWLAQCLVRKHPERVSKLILSNTSGPDGFATKAIKIGIFAARYYPLGFLKTAHKRKIIQLISPRDSERYFWEAFLNEEYSHVTRKDMLSRLQNTLDYMSNYKFSSDDLAEWTGQIFILESADDLAFQKTARESQKLLYPSAQICTLYDAGHAPSHRGSQEYISAINRFLSESPSL